jgi:hypothetical protein
MSTASKTWVSASCDDSPNEGSCAGAGGADRTTEKEGKKIDIAIETQKLNW